MGFYQLHELADAIHLALKRGKRIIVEHFDLVYPILKKNAHLLLGVGEEIIVTRPSIFGPEPDQVSQIVFRSISYRKMAHSAEELVEHCLRKRNITRYGHDDVRHGFVLSFEGKPDIDLVDLEEEVQEMIEAQIPISYHDDNHILLGDEEL